jgi:hypothetical protein
LPIAARYPSRKFELDINNFLPLFYREAPAFIEPEGFDGGF